MIYQNRYNNSVTVFLFLLIKLFLGQILDMYTYDDFAEFYDLEYGHKKDDLPFYLECACKYGSPVLEIGVGTGRVAIPLAQAGFKVVGIDSSMNMLKNGRAKMAKLDRAEQKRIQLIAQDMRRFSLHRDFPLCIVPFRTFLHNLTIKDQLSTLNSVFHSLTKRGILVIEIFVPLYSLLSQSTWEEDIGEQELPKEAGKLSLKVKVKHEPASQLLYISNFYVKEFSNGTIKCFDRTMTYRYVFRYEMELLLQQAGFVLKDVYSNFDQQPYNYFSGEMIFLAQRK